ncbi:hypothetical protein [Agriterribacter sp.]|uniref:hypothetical protein n=1 Tax=Agriterribacter sp. TaxID=2821509 RepID=UPI002D0457E3|nr:hypothetical protein [Agriterribacter sp.]HTN08395.1 hypothetical protein [Agriterribacter sp.]
MKKTILTQLLVSSLFIVNAQTGKGDWMAGGNFRLNTEKNTTAIGFTPNTGIFILQNLAIGGNVGFDYSKVGDNKATDFRIGPFARYYFTQANVRPFVHGVFNYLNRQVKTHISKNTEQGINYFLGGGAAIFLNDQVSLDALLGYNHSKLKGFDGSGGFAMTIGFQVYLLKHQVDKVRGR